MKVKKDDNLYDIVHQPAIAFTGAASTDNYIRKELTGILSRTARHRLCHQQTN